jgi:hypothetical protein
MKTQRTYFVWKTKSNGDLIEGTDRVLSGSSKKSVVKHLAHEEDTQYKEGDTLVRCKNGDIWFVRYSKI